MDNLRAIKDWIASHKYISLLIALVIFATIFGARFVANSYAGQLSGPIKRGEIVDAIYGIGTVAAYQRFSFNPQVTNTVEESYVMEGDTVKKGQPLLRTETVKHYAPFDGTVNFYPYRKGENAYTNSPMMVFTDMKRRYVLVSMEQQGAMRVKIGQVAKISFDSLRNQVFEGKVGAVYSYLSNFYARIDSVDLPDFILPDMTCDVAIVISKHEDALLIPVTAFLKGNVWIKRGAGLPHATPVKLGVIDGTNAEVVDGDLQPNDRVLIRAKVD